MPGGDTPVELSTKLPAPSSRQRPTSQRYVANRAFTTRYATQRTTAVCDHMAEGGAYSLEELTET